MADTTNTSATEQMVKDIHDRLASLQTAVSEQSIRGIVTKYLDEALKDETFRRKFRFGAGGDQRLVGSKFARFGLNVADVEFAYDMLNALRGHPKAGGGVHPGPSEQLEGAFKAISEARYIPEAEVQAVDKRALDDMWPRVPKALRTEAEYQRILHAIEGRTADSGTAGAMDTADSGYGSSLVGAQYVRDLWQSARFDTRVFGLIDTFEMTDPVAYLPVEADLPEMLLLSENTIRDPSEHSPRKTGSNKVTVTAYKEGIYQIWSSEMEEDSIIPLIPFYRRQAQAAINFYLDSLVLNGDTTTGGAQINTSSDPASTGKHYLAFDGIRHVGLVDNTANQKDMSGGAITYDALIDARARMLDTSYLMDWGHPTDPADLVYIAEPTTADAICKLGEVITVDKFGPNAVVLTGQVSRIGQHPLISSVALGKALATGLIHASTGNSYGVIVPFNRRGFKVGWRRRVQVKALYEPGTDQTKMLYSLRLGFGRYSPTGAASGIECADVIFDIGL